MKISPQQKVSIQAPNKPLTPEFLRKSSGVTDLTDEQATEIIEALYALAMILSSVTLPSVREELLIIENTNPHKIAA